MDVTDYSRELTLMLRIRGLWLRELGVVAGDSLPGANIFRRVEEEMRKLC